jgi:branched-chain amino acid transport system permease protein
MDAYLIISAVTLAATYGLLALGISLTYSSLGMINLAHGMTFAASGYGAWWVGSNVSSHPTAVVGGGIGTGVLCGLLICAVAYLPLKRQENYIIRSMTVTLALNIVVIQFLLATFGPSAKRIPDVFTFERIVVGPAVLQPGAAGAIGCSLLIVVLVLLWLRRTRSGLQVRALVQNPEGAALVGVSVNATALAVMAVSGGMAGLAAVLLQDIYYASPSSWVAPLVKGLIIALLGGLGSIPGALTAAGILGATEAVTAQYLGGEYVLMTQFALIIVIMVVRPRGIAGLVDEVREADE